MVICAIIGCSNRSDRDKLHYYHLPAIVKHQREQMLSITTRQCCAWLKAISRDDLTGDKLSNVFVCEKCFVHGKRYNNLGNDVYVLHLGNDVYVLHFTGKPAYHMYTFDVDWSPSVNLGHS